MIPLYKWGNWGIENLSDFVWAESQGVVTRDAQTAFCDFLLAMCSWLKPVTHEL